MCYGIECGRHGSCDPGSGKCVCDDPWFGEQCEQEDLCRVKHCGQHGQCVVRGGKRECDCDQGFSGDKCEISACSTMPCGNGRCVAGECRCHDGWSGEHCDHSANPCAGVVRGDHGECIDGTCSCDPSWS